MSIHIFPPGPVDELEYWRLIDPPVATDLLAEAIEYVRPLFDRQHSIHDRVRALWAGVLTAHNLNVAVWDVLEDEFRELARATGLTADLGRHGRENVEHVIRWTSFSNKTPF